MTPEKHCRICGKTLSPPRRVYCSDACAERAKLERRKALHPHRKKPGSPMYYLRICPDCGKEYMGHIKSVRCRACQEEANRRSTAQYHQRKAAGKVREIGSTDICDACGKPYTVSGSRQRYCPECAKTEVTKNLRNISRTRYRASYANPEKREEKNGKRRKPWKSEKACSVCGNPFVPTHPRQEICSDRCREIRKRENQRRADDKRPVKRSEYLKMRREAENLLPVEEQDKLRDERNARARNRYAIRKHHQGGENG